jgi:hypothetical protein
MKVFIGPPPLYRNIVYDILARLPFLGEVEKYNKIKQYHLTTTGEAVFDFFKKIKVVDFFNWCQYRKQEVEIQIDNYDVWGADHTLAMIILPVLKKLKTQKQGSPYVEESDVPEELRDNDIDNAEKKEEKLHARWDYVLNEMIWAFEVKCNDSYEDKFHTGELLYDFEPIDDGKYFEMKKKPESTYVFDRVGFDAYQKRKTNGFILFGKYYEGLWD